MSVSLQYSVAQKLQDLFNADIRVVGYQVISDVDASETPYTSDYTITDQDTSLAFLVLSAATAGAMTVTLYHGTTHASLVDTAALCQIGHNGIDVPAASVVLDLTTAEDKIALIAVNPSGREMSGDTITAWAGTTNKFSLKLSANASYTDNTTVVVVALAGGKRHQPGPGPA